MFNGGITKYITLLICVKYRNCVSINQTLFLIFLMPDNNPEGGMRHVYKLDQITGQTGL